MATTIETWRVTSSEGGTIDYAPQRNDYTLVLDNGQFVSGLVLREEGAVIVLADAQGKEQRVPKASVEQRIVSQLSPMPSNFAEQISEPEPIGIVADGAVERDDVRLEVL